MTPALHTAAGARLPLLTVAECAAYLRCSERAIRRRVDRARAGQGTFPYRRLGRSLRFMQSELDAWMVAERRAGLTRVA